MASKNFNFSKLASDVDTSGNILAGGIASSVSLGATVYDSTGLLPYVGNTAGDQVFVNSNNRLYIWQGSGWYNVALVNLAPSILSVEDSDGNTTPFALSSEGETTKITILATDSDGDPITYSATGDSNLVRIGSISQDGNEFTITPLSSDSATAQSAIITFKATDGVNISSSVNTFTLSFEWTVNLTNVTYDSKSFSVASQETAPTTVAFNSDGTKMYILGLTNDSIYQYTLSTAYDVSTASYDSVSFSVGSQGTSLQDMAFNTDGTKMYIVGSVSEVYQYSLSTAYNISTASYDSVSFDVGSQETSPYSMTFNGDGTKMYILGYGSAAAFQYSLSTAYNISTASYDSVSFNASSQVSDGSGIRFNSDGTKMYILDRSPPYGLHQYSLSTAYNISTASYDSVSFNVAQDTVPFGLTFSVDGTKMYIVGYGNDTIYQYSTGL